MSQTEADAWDIVTKGDTEPVQPPVPAANLRLGAVCAVLGSVLSVVAGARFDNLTVDASVEDILDDLASRPEWSWPLVGMIFVSGALLWSAAFIVIAASLRRAGARLLGRIAVAAIILGTAVHIIDSTINVGLSKLAQEWPGDSDLSHQWISDSAAPLIYLLGGTWPMVLMLFHGVPFIVIGLAIILDSHYPKWSAWPAIVGGGGSLVIGSMMFLGTTSLLYIVFAVLVTFWMVIIGALLWLDSRGAD